MRAVCVSQWDAVTILQQTHHAIIPQVSIKNNYQCCCNGCTSQIPCSLHFVLFMTLGSV